MAGRVAALSAKKKNNTKYQQSTNLICPTFVRGPHGEIFLLSHKKPRVRIEDDEGGQGLGQLFVATVSVGAEGLSDDIRLFHQITRVHLYRQMNYSACLDSTGEIIGSPRRTRMSGSNN